jgi:hypothetical protein
VSNVIQFLEAVGSRPLSPADYTAAVAAIDVGDRQRQALLDRDHAALNECLGGAKKMVFAILAADEDV